MAAYQVAPDPLFTLGGLDPPEPELFSTIGPVVLHPDSGIAVVDVPSAEIRVFDVTGHHVVTFGGRGEGPGEFGRIDALGGGNRLWTWDPQLRRVTELSWAAGPVDTYPLDRSGGGWPALVSFSATGDVAFGENLLDEPPNEIGRRLRHDSIAVDVIRDRGSASVHIGRFAGADLVHEIWEAGPGLVADMPMLPFGGDVFLETDGSRILLAHGSQPEVRVYGLNGALLEHWQFPGLARPAEPAFVDEWLSRQLNMLPDYDTTRLRARLEAFPPTRRPAFTDLVVSTTGETWLGELVGSGTDRTWLVVSGEGVVQGVVVLPGTFDLRAVSAEMALGVAKDELGVETLIAYGLSRPAANQ